MEVGFVGVGNDGRSLMAAAFADAELTDRGIDSAIDVVPGRVNPPAELGEPVLDSMAEVGLDLEELPSETLDAGDLDRLDLVVLVGRHRDGLEAEELDVETREWCLADPSGKDLPAVRSIRDDVAARVRGLVDELESTAVTPPA